ncbi:sporulation protein YpjB [Tepidibacillus fermentans]|uniref:Sporulation protein YpjB n=1 Tax=Tepidibacillus fermentans TaxID=1281767 RepID=A0A4R3KKB5_9BACI|nr:sporulation protein YpjB [Tepidibacillus fermentans]TCS84154.1 sporulation protein YpjB [Tepidibacillus fermentans]
MIKKIGYGIIITFLFFFFFLTDTKANYLENPSLASIQQLIQKLVESVQIKDYELAKQSIEQLSTQLSAIPYKGMTTIEGMEAITSTAIQVKRNLAALSPDDDQIAYSTTQLQLAIDALNHKEQPLWHRYYLTLRTDLNEIEKAINSNQKEKYEMSVQKYQKHYQMIKPAIQVSKPAYVVEKIDSLHTALASQKIDQNKAIILTQLKEALHELFYGEEKDVIGKIVEEKTLWNTTLGMGFVIFIVLSYVIWKKFKGAKINIST